MEQADSSDDSDDDIMVVAAAVAAAGNNSNKLPGLRNQVARSNSANGIDMKPVISNSGGRVFRKHELVIRKKARSTQYKKLQTCTQNKLENTQNKTRVAKHNGRIVFCMAYRIQYTE